jgi:hypothetical protein
MKKAQKKQSKAEKLVDKLVKDDVEALKVRSRINAGLFKLGGGGEQCGPKCGGCWGHG